MLERASALEVSPLRLLCLLLGGVPAAGRARTAGAAPPPQPTIGDEFDLVTRAFLEVSDMPLTQTRLHFGDPLHGCVERSTLLEIGVPLTRAKADVLHSSEYMKPGPSSRPTPAETPMRA